MPVYDVFQLNVQARVDANIDIAEVLSGIEGTQRTYDFTYRAGTRNATGFFMKWYWSQEDADADTNEITDSTKIPSDVAFSVDGGLTFAIDVVPEPHTGSDQEGKVRFTLPSVDADTTLFGRIGITEGM